MTGNKESDMHYLMRVAERFGSQIVIRVRNFSKDPTARFYAEIDWIEVESETGATLISRCGNGKTAEEALADYRSFIEGRVLAFHAGSKCECRDVIQSCGDES